MIIDKNGIKDTHENCGELPSLKEIFLCEEWISKYVRPQKDINQKAHSYSLKHRIEKDYDCYISNGAVICAAKKMGYKIKRDFDTSLNASFNMNIFFPEDEWKRTSPIGFTKWLFKQTKKSTLAQDAINDKHWPRRALGFLEFWDYLKNCHDFVKDELIATWRMYADEEPPVPDYELQDEFYDSRENFDCIEYEELYPKSPPNKLYIYALIDPLTNLPCYVGKTNNPTKRLEQHIKCPGSIEKVIWTANLLSKNLFPEMCILECVEERYANIREMALIYTFNTSFSPLFNKKGL